MLADCGLTGVSQMIIGFEEEGSANRPIIIHINVPLIWKAWIRSCL